MNKITANIRIKSVKRFSKMNMLTGNFKLLVLVSILALASITKAQVSIEKKIDIGGYRLNAVISGSGNPTVVFESGLGEDLKTWKDVQPNISRLTRTFVYDRAGLGQSEASPNSRDARQMAKELHALLHKSKVPGPYILVGHSLGGWIVSIFAHEFPKEVAGIVLVDPAYQESLLKAKISGKEWEEREKMILKYTPPMSRSQQLEKDALALSGNQALGVFPVPLVPVVLLSGTLTNPGFPASAAEKDIKLTVHDNWIAEVPWTKHVLVAESRHYIQNDAPVKVISAIEEIIEQVRNKKEKGNK